MAYNREGYAPWSLTRKAGVQSATVNGDIEVPQYVQPVLDTGFVDEKGDWKGTKSSDETFFISDRAEAIANGGEVLFPNTADSDFINMTGYNDLIIAVRPSNGGAYAFTAKMGNGSKTNFANLSPVAGNQALSSAYTGEPSDAGWYNVLYDGSETLTADKWNILIIYGRAKGQKNLQMEVTNNSGGNSNIDFAYMRMV